MILIQFCWRGKLVAMSSLSFLSMGSILFHISIEKGQTKSSCKPFLPLTTQPNPLIRSTCRNAYRNILTKYSGIIRQVWSSMLSPPIGLFPDSSQPFPFQLQNQSCQLFVRYTLSVAPVTTVKSEMKSQSILKRAIVSNIPSVQDFFDCFRFLRHRCLSLFLKLPCIIILIRTDIRIKQTEERKGKVTSFCNFDFDLKLCNGSLRIL